MSRESLPETINTEEMDEEAFSLRQNQIKKEREAEQGRTDQSLENEANDWLRRNGFDERAEINTAVTVMASFVCKLILERYFILSFFQNLSFGKSSKTIKPMPPKIIKLVIIKLTATSDLKPARLSE